MIQISSLRKEYHQVCVLDIPSLTIPDGQSLGLVGNNGAGKTTLFRLILDLTRATSGEVSIDNIKTSGSEMWKQHVGAFLDESFLIDYLRPEEYFSFVSASYGRSKDDVEETLDALSGFFHSEILGGKKLIREFSQGNKKKIGIAAALIAKPKVLILDEPFTALDPSGQIELKRLLNDLRAHRDMSILVSSHDLKHLTDTSDRVILLEKGKVLRDITSSETTLQELETYFAAIQANEPH